MYDTNTKYTDINCIVFDVRNTEAKVWRNAVTTQNFFFFNATF